MKIRTDFVTNSSSSSFVLFNIDNCEEIAKYFNCFVADLCAEHKKYPSVEFLLRRDLICSE